MNIEKIKEDRSKIPENLRLDYNFDDGFIYLHNDDETFALFEKEEIARSYQNMPRYIDNLLFLHVEMTPEQIEERQKEVEEWLKPVNTEKLEKEIEELKEENKKLREERFDYTKELMKSYCTAVAAFSEGAEIASGKRLSAVELEELMTQSKVLNRVNRKNNPE